jgi:hypothetical protein
VLELAHKIGNAFATFQILTGGQIWYFFNPDPYNNNMKNFPIRLHLGAGSDVLSFVNMMVWRWYRSGKKGSEVIKMSGGGMEPVVQSQNSIILVRKKYQYVNYAIYLEDGI